jgi:Bacterial Ig-like domain (group 3)
MTQSSTRSIRLALLCLAAVFVPLILPAATINVPADQNTIQAGIDAASNGDTVLVAPGTYYENINFKGKAITVTSSGGAESTTINGGRLGSTIIFSNNETRDSILSNFTITAGEGNGGIYITFASPTIVSNTITLNHCYGINSQLSSPLIQGNEISYTQAIPFECTFASGAGIWIYGNQPSPSSLLPEVIGNTIEQNTQSGLEDAGGNGGAGIAVWGGTPVIANNIIRNNATGKYFSPAGGGQGGGIYFAVDGGLVVNNLIYGNTSNLAGGGIFLGTENGGSSPTLAIINNTIVDNAVVPVTSFSQVVVGGEQIYYQGGFNSAYTVDLRLENNIIGGSTTNPSIVCYDGTVNPVTYSHNNFYNLAGPVTGVYGGGPCTFPSGTNGNISVDPAFASGSSQSYQLLRSSPEVDTGDNEAVQTAISLGSDDTTDLAAASRIQDATGNGCTIDIGAYEYPGATSDCSSTTETLHSSLNPSAFGQNVTFTAQLTSTAGTPTGDVQFSDGSTVISTQAVSSKGSATFSLATMSVGSHTVTATYQPGGTFAATSATLTEVVNGYPTTTGLISSLNPANAGQAITFTATVTSSNGTPTGVMTFSDGATNLGVQPLVNGVASFTTSNLEIGTHSIAAAYNPTGTAFGASNATLPEVVNGVPTTTTLAVTPTSAAFGTTIQMTAAVFRAGARVVGSPITFMDGTATLGSIATTATNPIATFSTAALAVGTHTITAVYPGDPLSGVSTSPAVIVTITSTPTTLGLSAAPNPGFALQPVTLTTKLAGAPAGSAAGNAISFLANGAVIGSATTDAQGNATLPATLVTGNYTISAAFAGTASLAPSTSPPVAEIINPNSTSTAVYAQPNPGYQGGNETLTASVGTLFASSATPAIPVGTVAFFDEGLLFATANLDARGQAAFSTAALTVGSHSIIATYLGTPNFLNSISSPYILNILPRDFTLTTDPTITIQTQHHKDLDLTLASIGDFTDTVALSCANLPAYATCTFPGNGQVLVAGGTQASSVHVDTDALLNYISSNAPASHLQDSPRPGRGVAYGLLLPVTLFAALRRRRKLPRIMGLCIAISLSLIAMTFTGCSAHYPGHTPPGTYTFNVTGQGATTHISHTATVTLIVTE